MNRNKLKYRNTTKHKQLGSALFIVIMILMALTILTFMATNIGKTDARIGNAYAEQTRAFIQAEAMLARLRFALEQMPIPEGIQNEGSANKTNRPIWLTEFIVKDNKMKGASADGEPDFTDPRFAKNTEDDNWDNDVTLTCEDLKNWMKNTVKIDPLDCEKLDPQAKSRTIIELVSRKKSKGDIADIRDAFYYRITIRAEGDRTGSALAQGITGVQYN